MNGDSLSMTGTDIRLFGIDAPEGAQTCQRDGAEWACGDMAKRQLAELVDGKQLRCDQRHIDRYGRVVATCHVGNLDLARIMVEAGLAIALPAFTEAYVDPEARARQRNIGIWGSTFQEPDAWRAANSVGEHGTTSMPRAARPATQPSKSYRNSFGCSIKGNRNRQGQWIYHLPGMPYYEATRPEELFCTEADAQAAGYRRARL